MKRLASWLWDPAAEPSPNRRFSDVLNDIENDDFSGSQSGGGLDHAGISDATATDSKTSGGETSMGEAPGSMRRLQREASTMDASTMDASTIETSTSEASTMEASMREDSLGGSCGATTSISGTSGNAGDNVYSAAIEEAAYGNASCLSLREQAWVAMNIL